MKTPHFFKASSRIGLTNKPVRQEEWNIGVEEAPDAILTDNFLGTFRDYEVDKYVFPKPENIKNKEYIIILKNNLESFKGLINSKLKSGQTQVVIGGENSATFSSFLALLERVNDSKKVGYIQFDSHGEMNSFRGSVSKNFHGMYMRPFFEEFDIKTIADLVHFKLKSSQALFVGDLVLDGDEPEFFSENGFKNIKRVEFLQNSQKILDEIKNFVFSFEYLHVNFDIDVFLESEAGATGIPEDGKWMKGEVLKLLEMVSNHPNLSFDFMEVNPKKPNAQRTIKLAQEILKLILN